MARRRITRYNPRMVYLTVCVADYLQALGRTSGDVRVPAASPADMASALGEWWSARKGGVLPYTGRALATQLGRAAHLTRLLAAVGVKGSVRIWLHVEHASSAEFTGTAMDGLFSNSRIEPESVYPLSREQYFEIFDKADSVPAAEVESLLRERGILCAPDKVDKVDGVSAAEVENLLREHSLLYAPDAADAKPSRAGSAADRFEDEDEPEDEDEDEDEDEQFVPVPRARPRRTV